jgi:hypothetical protein
MLSGATMDAGMKLSVRAETTATLVRRWSLTAVVVVSAAVPWYTLRLFPVLTVHGAAINGLDVLVAVAVASALPLIVRDLRSKRDSSLVVAVFLVYMLVPLGVGIWSGHRFFAIREFRPLAFYALALVFVAGNHTVSDYRLWTWSYVAAATLTAAAVFAHLRWLVPLPGYPATISAPVDFRNEFRVEYLDWTVPVTALALALGSLLVARRRWAAILSAGAVCVLVWYILATTERFMQVVSAAMFLIVTLVLAPGTRRSVRLAEVGAVLVVGAVGLHGIREPWFDNLFTTVARRWLLWHADGSLGSRLREVQAGFAGLKVHFVRSLLLGKGLGAVTSVTLFPGQPKVLWPYFSSGYALVFFHTGLVGLCLYLGMAAKAMMAAGASAGKAVRDGAWPAHAFGMIGLTGLLLVNVLYPAADVSEGAVAFSLFYGMLHCRGPEDRRVSLQRAGGTGRRP